MKYAKPFESRRPVCCTYRTLTHTPLMSNSPLSYSLQSRSHESVSYTRIYGCTGSYWA